MELTEFVNRERLWPEDILDIISAVGRNKDVIIVKNDGIRDDNQYTVIIISSKNPEISFRCDNNSLQVAIKEVLNKYIKES